MSSITWLQDQAGKGPEHLVHWFCATVTGRSIPVESLFSLEQRQWIFRELTRQDEVESAYDAGERLTWTKEHMSPGRQEQIQRPTLDEFIVKWQGRLSTFDLEQNAEPTWPEAKPFALCITHDVDHVSSFGMSRLYRRFFRYARYPGRQIGELAKLALISSRGTASTLVKKSLLQRPDSISQIAEWMKIEDALGFRSTFFFLPSTVRPWHPFDCDYSFSDSVLFDGHRMSVAQMMREIVGRGWDVGLHGSYYSATVPGMLRHQKEELERVLGRAVLTTRQHTLQYDPRLTPTLQAEAGLMADSTQGFNDLIGFRAGTSFPYLCWDWQKKRTLPLLEVPLHIQDGPLIRGSRTEMEAIEACLELMDAVQSVGGCLVMLWHPWVLATDIGLNVFRSILEEAKLRNAWGCSLRRLVDWWISRSRRILSQRTVQLNGGALPPFADDSQVISNDI